MKLIKKKKQNVYFLNIEKKDMVKSQQKFYNEISLPKHHLAVAVPDSMHKLSQSLSILIEPLMVPSCNATGHWPISQDGSCCPSTFCEGAKWPWFCPLHFKVCHCNRLWCVVLKFLTITVQIFTHENTLWSFDSRNFWEVLSGDCVSALRGRSPPSTWKDSKLNYPACLSLISFSSKKSSNVF